MGRLVSLHLHPFFEFGFVVYMPDSVTEVEIFPKILGTYGQKIKLDRNWKVVCILKTFIPKTLSIKPWWAPIWVSYFSSLPYKSKKAPVVAPVAMDSGIWKLDARRPRKTKCPSEESCDINAFMLHTLAMKALVNAYIIRSCSYLSIQELYES